jgi:hypothetical protein
MGQPGKMVTRGLHVASNEELLKNLCTGTAYCFMEFKHEE